MTQRRVTWSRILRGMRYALAVACATAAAVACGSEDQSWMAKSASVCSSGLVSRSCKCGGMKVASGYCCSGAAQDHQCLVIPEEAGDVSHFFFTSTGIGDTAGIPWAAAGSPTIVAASGTTPTGSGGNYSNTVYWGLGTGSDVLDFTGEWIGYALYKPNAAASKVLFGNSTYNASGWHFSITTSPATKTYIVLNGASQVAYGPGDASVPGKLNFACFGRIGNAPVAKANWGGWWTGSAITPVAGTSQQMRIGNMSGGSNAFDGVVYEGRFRAATPAEATCDAVRDAVTLQLAGSNVIVALGDSLTQVGYASNVRPYPRQLQILTWYDWYTWNAGLSGDRTDQMLARWTSTWAAKKPKITIVWGGINDCWQDVPAATAVANLTAIYDSVRASGSKLVVLTVGPWKNHSAYTTGREAQRVAINAWIPTYVAAHPADTLLVDMATTLDNGDGTLKAACDSGDHLHILTACTDQAAQVVYDASHAVGWW